MQNACTHIGQFTQLAKCYDINGTGMVDNAGIGNQKTGNVRPVLINICTYAARDDRAGNVGSAA